MLVSPLGLWSVLLVALSLSIGWGIRGNYGHELGAAFPGALAAIAACLVSARSDWQQRVAHFALFGGLGWTFGGSISYMMVIGYTHSGQLETEVFGFAGLFLIGFLWGSFGGAGTVVPAVLDRARLYQWYRALPALVVVWLVLYAGLPALIDRLQTAEGAMRRQESSLYWFDADWLSALTVLLAAVVYDLVRRRFAGVLELGLATTLGAGLGWAAQQLIERAGLAPSLTGLLVRPQGDLENFPAEKLVTNWPNFFSTHPEHVGWLCGLALGLAVYLGRKHRPEGLIRLASYLSGGWLLAFLVLPVLAGVRLTPPRSDDWAGILGAFLGLLVFCYQEKLPQVAWAAIVAGTVGGLGFSGTAAIKLAMISLGNPHLEADPAVVASWKHWQSANWHSFLEQTYGFINGLGIALVMGLLARRNPPLDDQAPRQRWTEVLAVTLSLPLLAYVNLVKNVNDWTRGDPGAYRAMPETMKAPWWPAGEGWNWPAWEWTAWGWFNFFFGIASAAIVLLLLAHLRRPIALLPSAWLGRGQLLYLVLLWTFVIGNFGKALAGFHESRLLTEGVILVHAVLASALVLLVPRAGAAPRGAPGTPVPSRLAWAAAGLVLAIALAIPAETWVVRSIYGDQPAGHSGKNLRFGPEANWRVAPILKGELHR